MGRGAICLGALVEVALRAPVKADPVVRSSNDWTSAWQQSPCHRCQLQDLTMVVVLVQSASDIQRELGVDGRDVRAE